MLLPPQRVQQWPPLEAQPLHLPQCSPKEFPFRFHFTELPDPKPVQQPSVTCQVKLSKVACFCWGALLGQGCKLRLDTSYSMLAFLARIYKPNAV